MEIRQENLVIETVQIKKMMDLLSNLFSIRTSFIYAVDDEQYTREIAGNNGDYQEFCILIQEEMKDKCIACDRDKFKEAKEKREPLLYRCYNGLYEMFLPLFIENSLVGYLHFGQIRSEDNFDLIARECSLTQHSRLKELEKSYNAIKIIEKEKLFLISELFLNLSEIILQNRFIELRRTKPEYYLKKYIEENLSQSINLKTAAKFVNRSPSYVTHRFKEVYNCSFHHYLTQTRIDHSKKLLKDYPVSQVYQLCGFKNRFHFSKVFKSIEGITPHQYQVNFSN